MLQLRSDDSNAVNVRAQLDASFRDQHDRLHAEIGRHTIKAQIRRELVHMRAGGEPAEQVEAMQTQAAELAATLDQLRAEVGRLAPLAEAQREVVREIAVEEFSEAYRRDADGHARSWRAWLFALGGSGVLALIAGLYVVHEFDPPTDATNAQIASAVVRDVLVVGILLYMVRVAAHQFRVHRHLEAVARSKAAALQTFNRLVTGQTDPEVRSAMAITLCQAVFASGNTGFIDASADQITVIERVMGAAIQRVPSTQ
ncbi:MAG TPA: hypothetical protein VE777_11055 [Gaiellales bacterium]|jgi:hypothetical protein|nr:hypothetical protein [Gaiellales bacterium]